MRSIVYCSIVQKITYAILAEQLSNRTIGQQVELNCGLLSIATNIAEGNGRYHKADRVNFFRIGRGSAFECIPIIELCRRKGLIKNGKSKILKENLDEICKMLSGLMNY